MALQQHEPTAGARVAAADPSAAPDEQASQRSAALIRRLQASAQAGDVAAYAAALAEFPSIDDRDHVHHARIAAGHVVLRAPLAHPQAVIAGLLEALLVASVDWLEQEPSEPVLLAQAGLAALELGAYRGAERLLTAAATLDPSLPEIDKPRREAAARRRARARATHVSAASRRRLDGLRQRIDKIAAAAGPNPSLRISLCMIVRDEEEMLPQCLAAAAPGVDEIVIVDTGSTDRTVEIAREFGARVLFHEWTGNFGEARNVGLNAATGDWLLILDADEVLVDGDAELLHAYKTQSWREAFFLDSINYTGDLDHGAGVKQAALRMIRNRPHRRYDGLVHEQIAYSLPGFLPDRFAHTEVRMHHYGYLGAVRESRDKDSRNLPLLLEQLAENPDEAFVHFNLGSEYVVLDEVEPALKHLRRAWELLPSEISTVRGLGFAPSLCSRFVRVLRVAGEFDELQAVAARAHEYFPKFTDVYFEQAMVDFDRGDLDAAERGFLHCLELGDARGTYSATVGCGSFHAQLRLVRIELLRGDGDAAIARLRQVREEHPKVLEAIDPLASSLLVTGHAPQAVFDELTSGELSPTGWFMLGVNLQERGHLDLAELAYRGAIERRPALAMARVALADLLLVLGRFDEAASEARHVAPDARSGGAAVRSALFALLAGDAPEAARDDVIELVSALPQTDLGDREQAVLAAWAASRLGVGEAPPLLADDLGLLDTLLDASLRAGAVTAFADLLELVALTGVDGRQQHQVAATALLRRGLAEPAADAWIASVQAFGPDADAYAGLAEAARQQQLDEDARTLAQEALELDPGHPLAGRVLAALES